MHAQDIADIQQLMALSAHAVDAVDPVLMARAFTEDAVYDARAGTGGHGEIAGRQAILDWFALGKPPHPPSHNLFGSWIDDGGDPDAGEVRVHSKWLVIDRRDGTAVSGDYHDIVVRTPDGWRIRRRRFTFRYPEAFAGFGDG
ncbi:MAG: nuclear transport factor 2 family protein [Sphingomonadales bacterium]|nr:nuclear transport factor 2 family protein [Sphingomonadales bacterium]